MSLRVLITNHTLDKRAGTELYVKDLAVALLRRGHTPIAYSTQLGKVAQELRRATVPVVDNLELLSLPPDIIHGHHHLETMTALLHFPGVPAIYFCHSWWHWEEAPPRFPRIGRYVAVDDTCRDRLVFEHGIPEKNVCVIRNFVDLDRFKPRSPLPDRPKRALVFSNSATEKTFVAAIRSGCARSGIDVDVVGSSSGRSSSAPEQILGGYDIVFAKARCAFEAMAVGAAVVLCDQVGIGPMVTSVELEALRRLNFGVRTLCDQTNPDLVAREIARYDPIDAAEVTRRIRASSGAESTVDQIIDLYDEVLHEPGQLNGNGHSDGSEARFAAAYLRSIARRMNDERDQIYSTTSYRLGNLLVRTPLLNRLARRVVEGSAKDGKER